MRLVKNRILCVWEQQRSEAKDRTAEQERRVKAIQKKLDRLDEAFLDSESIDLTSYSRQRDKLREELTLAKIEAPYRELSSARLLPRFDAAVEAANPPRATIPTEQSPLALDGAATETRLRDTAPAPDRTAQPRRPTTGDCRSD